MSPDPYIDGLLKKISQANMYISMLEADYAAALKDARRYRWWRDGEMRMDVWLNLERYRNENLDEAIDYILEHGEEEWLEHIKHGYDEKLGQSADAAVRGQAAGLNSECYKPGRE